MTVRNTKGLEIHLGLGTTTPVTVTPTAISDAKPAAVSVSASDIAKVKAGMPVTMSGTGFPQLDGKTFIVGTVDATGGSENFTLLGSDTTAAGGPTLGAAPVATVYAEGTDLEKLCLSSIGINGETPASVSVATFCDPSASVSGSSSSAGTLDLAGYMDPADKGYQLLLDAEADGNERVLKINFPGAGGYLLAKGTISSMLLSDIPLDGAVAYAATMQLSAKPVHIF